MQTVTITSLTVVSNATQIDTTNWACVKATTNDWVYVKATLSTADTNAANLINWSVGNPVAYDPFQRKISKGASQMIPVMATVGAASTNLNVWVIWATVQILTNGTYPSLLSFDYGNPGSSVSNQLGVHYFFWNSNSGSMTLGSITNSDSVLGEVCVMATISPNGVGRIIEDDWNIFQMKQNKIVYDGIVAGASSQNWTNDNIPELFKWRHADPNLYLLDGPGIINAPNLVTNSLEHYVNFYDYVTWNSQICSDTNCFWYLKAIWNANQTPKFSVDLGSGTITIP